MSVGVPLPTYICAALLYVVVLASIFNCVICEYLNRGPAIAVADAVPKVSEIAAVNTYVTSVTVVDLEEGPAGDVDCTLDDDTFGLERISDRNYKMNVMKPLDRETKSSYDLTVTCTDKGTPPLSTLLKVKVVVLDENDNKPVFSFPVKGNDTVYVYMKAPLHMATFTVHATDADAMDNAKIIYSLANHGLDDMFSIETKNNQGVIKVLRFPDSDQAYGLLVQATDTSPRPLKNVAMLNVLFVDADTTSRAADVTTKSGSTSGQAGRGAGTRHVVILALGFVLHVFGIMKFNP